MAALEEESVLGRCERADRVSRAKSPVITCGISRRRPSIRPIVASRLSRRRQCECRRCRWSWPTPTLANAANASPLNMLHCSLPSSRSSSPPLPGITFFSDNSSSSLHYLLVFSGRTIISILIGIQVFCLLVALLFLVSSFARHFCGSLYDTILHAYLLSMVRGILSYHI